MPCVQRPDPRVRAFRSCATKLISPPPPPIRPLSRPPSIRYVPYRWLFGVVKTPTTINAAPRKISVMKPAGSPASTAGSPPAPLHRSRCSVARAARIPREANAKVPPLGVAEMPLSRHRKAITSPSRPFPRTPCPKSATIRMSPTRSVVLVIGPGTTIAITPIMRSLSLTMKWKRQRRCGCLVPLFPLPATAAESTSPPMLRTVILWRRQ